MKTKLIFLTIFLVTISLSIGCDPINDFLGFIGCTGDISGRVIIVDNTDYSGVKVGVEPEFRLASDKPIENVVYTDNEGNFLIENVVIGARTVMVIKEDYGGEGFGSVKKPDRIIDYTGKVGSTIRIADVEVNLDEITELENDIVLYPYFNMFSDIIATEYGYDGPGVLFSSKSSTTTEEEADMFLWNPNPNNFGPYAFGKTTGNIIKYVGDVLMVEITSAPSLGYVSNYTYHHYNNPMPRTAAFVLKTQDNKYVKIKPRFVGSGIGGNECRVEFYYYYQSDGSTDFDY